MPDRPGLRQADLGDPLITLLIDEDACATAMTMTHRALFATREPDRPDDLAALVAAVDALDLWRKDSPAFPGGTALDELFWDNATGLVPDVPGMHGPNADRDAMVKVLVPKADGGILNSKGVVDFTVGKGVAPGWCE